MLGPTKELNPRKYVDVEISEHNFQPRKEASETCFRKYSFSQIIQKNSFENLFLNKQYLFLTAF